MYNDSVVVGFAGSTAEAFTLCEKFESALNKYSGSLMRSAVEIARNLREQPNSGKNWCVDDCSEQRPVINFD